MGDERDIQREAAAFDRAATDDSQNEPPDFDDDDEGDSMAMGDEREGLPRPPMRRVAELEAALRRIAEPAAEWDKWYRGEEDVLPELPHKIARAALSGKGEAS